MLVPNLADVSTASVTAALQRRLTCELSAEAHVRQLQAVGALMQQLCPAEPPLVCLVTICYSQHHNAFLQHRSTFCILLVYFYILD